MSGIKEIDVRVRAAAALVEAWQRPHQTVRTIWKLEEMIELLVATIDEAHETQLNIGDVNGQPIADGEAPKASTTTVSYFLETLQRLRTAADALLHVVELFEGEKSAVGKSDELRQGIATLSHLMELIDFVLEDTEWRELETELMPTAELVKIRDYLRSTGQASA